MSSWKSSGIGALALMLASCNGDLDPNAPAWQQVSTGALPARWGQVAVDDQRRDRMLVFGGDDGSASNAQLNDLWALELTALTWDRLHVQAGAAPSPRTDLASALDLLRDRWIIIGGRVGLGTSIGETWALDLKTLVWKELPQLPTARHDVPATSDGGRAWVFGGAGVLFQSLDDLWELDFATDTWTQLPDDGVRPPARGSSSLAYSSGSIYMFGGHDVAVVHRDAWRYDLAKKRWFQLEPGGAAVAVAHFGYATDPICNELFLSGGDNLDNFDVAFTDRLALGGSPRFARVHTSAMPPPRDHASLIVDGGHRRLVLLGGGSLGDGLGLRGDAWIYPLGACP